MATLFALPALALRPSSMRFAGHWAVWGRKKGLGPHAACKLLYSLAHTHASNVLGACRRPQLVTVCAARIIIMCFIWDCARPAVRNHLRCSYCPNSSIYCIVFPSSCFTGLKESTYTHTYTRRHTHIGLLSAYLILVFLAFVSTCVKLQNQSIRLRIRNIYKYLMLSFIRIFSVKPSPSCYFPPSVTTMRFHVM